MPVRRWAGSSKACFEPEIKMKAVLFDLDDTLHDKSSTLHLMAEFQRDSFNLSRYQTGLSQASPSPAIRSRRFARTYSIAFSGNDVTQPLTAVTDTSRSRPISFRRIPVLPLR